MNLRWLVLVFAVALGSKVPCGVGQEISTETGGRYDYTAKLAFARDGRALREFREVSSEDGRFRRVHAITYDLPFGAVSHLWKLEPYTRLDSATTDGRKAIISMDTDTLHPGRHRRLLLLDAETGLSEEIPAEWSDDAPNRKATISGDGRLIGTYLEAPTGDTPMVVRVYDWQTQRLIATQTSELISAGGFFGGGVTEDGKIEFLNNRTGSKIVDPKTGRLLIEFGPNAVRSPDGKWVVELAGHLHARDRTETTVLDGLSGKTRGKLDLEFSETVNFTWSGVFCGTTGRFIAWNPDSALVFNIPSLKQIATIPADSWRDPQPGITPKMSVACSWNGKRVAIRSGGRLTLHGLD